MAIFLTNRQLAEITGFGHASWRKWVSKFLHPDPRIGQFAGVPRQHSIDDAFRVFLGGRLITQCRLAIPDAQAVTKEIFRLLETRKWMPSDYMSGKDDLSCPGELFFIFWKTNRDTFRFKLKAVMSRRPKDPLALQKTHFIEEFELVRFGDKRGRKIGPRYQLGISPIEFIKDVREYLIDRGLEPEEDPTNIPGVIRMFHPDEE